MVVIDVGINNEKFLNDLLYLGNKYERVIGEKYDNFIEEFVKVFMELFLEVFMYWEDFGCGNVSRIFEKYRDKICIFNDDI